MEAPPFGLTAHCASLPSVSRRRSRVKGMHQVMDVDYIRKVEEFRPVLLGRKGKSLVQKMGIEWQVKQMLWRGWKRMNMLFPQAPRCAACQGPLEREGVCLCSSCVGALPLIRGPVCVKCGGRCPVQGAQAIGPSQGFQLLGLYQGPCREMIHQVQKRNRELEFGLGELRPVREEEVLRSLFGHRLVFPLTQTGWRGGGFDQAGCSPGAGPTAWSEAPGPGGL